MAARRYAGMREGVAGDGHGRLELRLGLESAPPPLAPADQCRALAVQDQVGAC